MLASDLNANSLISEYNRAIIERKKLGGVSDKNPVVQNIDQKIKLLKK